MGRRALRKIDPTLDLTGYCYEAGELPLRFEPMRLFGRTAPLEVEVGSGKGMFLAAASAARPDRDFLGIEIAWKYARFAAAKLARAERTNAAVLQIDAGWVFRTWLPDESAAAVHIYFPDPWWKKRHRKRRILTESFATDVQRVLEPGGQLQFWTDIEEYFRTSLDVLRRATQLSGPFWPEAPPATSEQEFRTHFDRRRGLHNQPVYRAEFRKPSSIGGRA